MTPSPNELKGKNITSDESCSACKTSNFPS